MVKHATRYGKRYLFPSSQKMGENPKNPLEVSTGFNRFFRIYRVKSSSQIVRVLSTDRSGWWYTNPSEKYESQLG